MGHPDFDVAGGHMVDVIKNTSRLAEEDRLSIAKYLKAIPGVKIILFYLELNCFYERLCGSLAQLDRAADF